MKQRLLNVNDVLKGEMQTIADTQHIYKGISNEIPRVLNVLLQLNYFKGRAPDIKTDEGNFHSYCGHQYLHSPYSFRGCYILWERGYYLEAAIIFRVILERFIQIRHVYKHKNLVTVVWSSIKHKTIKPNRVTFKTMFNDITPGYYDKWYGGMLSGFAHSKVAANYFRIRRSSPTDAKVNMIPSFDERGTLVINHMIPLLFGYLRFFPIFFPSGFKSISCDLLKEYDSSISYLQVFMTGFKKRFPKSLSWYEHIDKIVNP